MSSSRFSLGALLLGASLFGCASIEPIAAATCGNGVVETGEDCDGFPVGEGTACRPSNAGAAACRLDCTAAADGTRPACPTGWGCGTDGVCRAPKGSYTPVGDPISAGAWRLAAGDFDGDGRDDVLTRDRASADGRSKLRAHFFDEQPVLADVLSVPGALASPVVRDVTGDGRADVTFATNDGIGVLVGSGTRQLVPAAYPTFSIEKAVIRPLVVPGFPTGLGVARDQILLFIASDALKGIVVPDLTGGPPLVVTDAPRPDSTVGGVVLGRFNEAPGFPCPASVWAVDGAQAVTIFPLCTVGAGPDDVGVWNTAAIGRVQVALPPTVVLSKAAGGGVLVADVNGDHHEDLLVGVGNKTYVAYGDGAGGFRENADAANPGAANRALELKLTVLDNEAASQPLPLAAADVNGDVMTDYVLATRVLVSTATAKGIRYRIVQTKDKGSWDQAAIADFNGNGFLDVIAGSSSELDLTFFNGTGQGTFNPFTVPTAGPVDHFAVGDADGDLLPDLAFAMGTGFGTAGQALAVAWGRLGAPPGAATSIGAFENIVDVLAFDGANGPKNLAVAFQPQSPAAGAIALLAGSGDRQPLAPLRLPESQAISVPYAAATGVFTKGATPDVAAFSRFVPTRARPGLGEEPTAVWLGKSIGPAQFQAPVHGEVFGDALVPSINTAKGQRNATLLATGDLDGDGVDEAVLVAPFAVSNGSKAAIFVARVGGTASQPSLEPPTGGGVEIPFAVNQEGQLAVEDVDGDGKADIVFLSGTIDTVQATIPRSLVVFWNQGGGVFSGADSLTVADVTESPEGFAFLRDRTGGQRSLAYVATAGVTVARLQGRAVEGRALVYDNRSKDRVAAALTGLAAGDFNGDGVQDIAVAELTNLVILRGEPVLQ